MQLGLAVDIESNEDAERLVDLAVRWAERTGATLDLLYVEPTHATTGWIQDPSARQLVKAELDRMHHLASVGLTELLDRVPEDRRGVARVLEGLPVPALVKAAEGYDALLVGTHGRTGLSHFWLGSVAEQVVRQAMVPVLVLRLPEPG